MSERVCLLDGLAPLDARAVTLCDEIVDGGNHTTEARLVTCPKCLAACASCFGRGWYPEFIAGTEDDSFPDYREKYCACAAGERLKVSDGAS